MSSVEEDLLIISNSDALVLDFLDTIDNKLNSDDADEDK